MVVRLCCRLALVHRSHSSKCEVVVGGGKKEGCRLSGVSGTACGW